MDLSRVDVIRNTRLADLKTASDIEALMYKVGLNTEVSWTLPEIILQNEGGLRVWQYPNQFSKYLLLISSLDIRSYIEIGCRWGGTFVLTTEYLTKLHPLTKSVATDIIDSPVKEYCAQTSNCQFLRMDSHSEEFKTFMAENSFDLVFIDGDHSYEGVKQDFWISKNSGRAFVFHDIVNSECPGVIRFWNELKEQEDDTYTFYEFNDQYEEVLERTGRAFLGIGVAVRK